MPAKTKKKAKKVAKKVTGKKPLPREETALSLIVQGSGQVSDWSDVRRTKFCETLKGRSNFARAVLATVAETFWHEAKERFFVPSNASYVSFPVAGVSCDLEWRNGKCVGVHLNGHGSRSNSYDGRTGQEVADVASERTMELINELPEALAVVQVIKPATAHKMEELEKKEKLLTQRRDRLNEISGDTELDDDFIDEHGQMTLKDFRLHVRKINAEKKKLVRESGVLGKQVDRLRRDINRSLYRGVPTLEKAARKVVEEMRQECVALGQMERRVSEHVMFGDSEAAVKVLQRFEKDEVELAPEAHNLLATALDRLKKIKSLPKGKSQIGKKS